MRGVLPLCAIAIAAALAPVAPADAQSDPAPLGEPLHAAAQKYGLGPADVASILAAGGELACPGDGNDGARLNAWLVSPRQIVSNAHGIIEGEQDPGHPFLRQPVAACYFTSFRDLAQSSPHRYLVNLDGLGAVLRRGAQAPVDPPAAMAGDLVKLRLKDTVRDGMPLPIDTTPVKRGGSLLLVSRVPTAYRTDALPGNDLLIEACSVTALDPPTAEFSPAAITDCNGAEGMSAGILLAREGGRLVAKGLLVALEYVRVKGKASGSDQLVGAHVLLFDAKFTQWLAGDCAFWPAALRISFCGVKR